MKKNKEKFIEQQYYQCYQCDLIDGKGCCTVCAARCHANHDVSYSKKAPFYCDCGFSNCQSMKADKGPGKFKKFNPSEMPNNNKIVAVPSKSPSNSLFSSLGGGIVPKFEPPESGNPGQKNFYGGGGLFGNLVGGLGVKPNIGGLGGMFGAMQDPFSSRTLSKELITEKNFEMMIPTRILGEDLGVVNLGRSVAGINIEEELYYCYRWEG